MKQCPRHGLSRRQFLGHAGAVLGAGAALTSGAGCAKARSEAATARAGLPAPSPSPHAASLAPLLHLQGATAANAPKVGIGRSPSLWSDQNGVNAETLEKVLDESIMWLTGADSAEKAWKSLANSDEVIGLKPNGLGGLELATSTEIIVYCVDRLTGIGVKRDNIIVWEQTPSFIANCGVPIDQPPWGVKAAITGQTLGQRVRHGTIDDTLTKVVTEWCDGFINLPILKDHGIAGVTLSMKNHYGTVSNPGAIHGNTKEQIADLASIPAIKDKTRLIICDLTHCVVDGGPGGVPHYFPNGVMVAKDMVAHDAIGAQIIAEERARRGMPSIEQAGRPAGYIKVAEQRGVGVADPSKIAFKELSFA